MPVAAKGQAPIHVVAPRRARRRAGRGRRRGREELYGPIDPGPLPDRDDALRELARRYAAAHAPGEPHDFARLVGAPGRRRPDAWAEHRAPGDAEPEARSGCSRRSTSGCSAGRRATSSLPAEHAKRVAPGGGIIRPVAIADGRVFATWRLDRRRRRIELDPFGRVTKAMRAGVEAEVEAIAAFLGEPLTLTAAG